MRTYSKNESAEITGEMDWGSFGPPSARPKKPVKAAPPPPGITLQLSEPEAWAISVLVRATLAGAGPDPVLARILEKLKGM